MEPESQKAETRKEIQKSSEQRQTKRNLLFFSLFLLTAFLPLITGHFYLTKKQTRVQTDKSIEQQQEPDEKIVEIIAAEQQKLGNQEVKRTVINKQRQHILFLPDLPLKKELEKQLQQLLTDAETQLSEDQSAKVIGYTESAILGKTVIYTPVVDLYYKNEELWEIQPLLRGENTYVSKDTLELPTLTELFHNQNNFRAIQPIIRQKLLDTMTADEVSQQIDKIIDFPNSTMEQKILDYTPNQFTFSLPENELNIKQLSLDFTEIIPFVDQEFVDSQLIRDHAGTSLDSNKKYIALTFDDGPNPLTTPKLLDILREKNVKTTFFMLGENAAKHPEIVRRAVAEGHDVASHSYSHPKLTAIEPKSIKEEVHATDKVLFEITGKLPTTFRPPYGAVDSQAAEIIDRPIIQWSVDSEDWKSKNSKKIIKRVQETSNNYSIILMHDIYSETVEAVPKIIDDLRAEGYEIISPDELLGNKLEPLHLYYGNKTIPVSP
ncbi:polysaccharide deacetylase family protein [Enterococcus sp. BWT-B8]|uniref:polysaccharide deacetylase family protein n=1 Tax=Enterococcus sp. BWT-B8 TaxID=2885157 RepID=UPI001E4FB34C|nr:polysaccharide deacetylase family protein [Enterococcus sp. BWT-B8]MCB5951323.1 polysaccharide deacetylase family protein [Enterococcus sp. BWT-B8]